jgi:tetratricopeptide (TPR) repeat protein
MKDNQGAPSRAEIESVFGLYSNGKIHQAIDQIKILNQKYPNQPILFNLIGACYKSLDQLEGAAQMFNIAVSLNPNYSEAYFNLACIKQDLDFKEEAVKFYKKAIEIRPNYPEAHNNLGNVLRGLEDYKLSIESLEWAIAYKHDYFEAHNNLGSAFLDFGRVEDAIKSFKRALSYKPDYTRALFNLALAFKDQGNKKSWVKMIKKTLAINPMMSEAHLELSRAKRYKNADPHIDEVHNLITNENISLKDRINFNFILAKVYEDIEDQVKQFKYLNEANKLRKKESNYSIEKDQNLFAHIKEAFKKPPASLNTSKLNSKSFRPIFIVGMPRSGTSLVHQILSSHSMVHGAGELNKIYKFSIPVLKDLKTNNIENISEDSLLSIRSQYLEFLSSLGVNEKIFVDKMPLNFRFIGFIIAAFPEAKIIHMKRNPMAICWSIYKNFFPGNSYSYDQEDTANYYKLYEDLMNYWEDLYPNKIFNFNYEQLTSSQEKETKRLLEYCEIPWDENCLDFHNNSTMMRTTSAMQVKKKMYQGSSEEWKKFADNLQTLIAGLK